MRNRWLPYYNKLIDINVQLHVDSGYTRFLIPLYIHIVLAAITESLNYANIFLNAFFSLSRFSFLRCLSFDSSPAIALSSGTRRLASIRSFSASSSSFRMVLASALRYSAFAVKDNSLSYSPDWYGPSSISPLSGIFNSNLSRARVVFLIAMLAFSADGGSERVAARAELRRSGVRRVSKESFSSGGELSGMTGCTSRYRIDSTIELN